MIHYLLEKKADIKAVSKSGGGIVNQVVASENTGKAAYVLSLVEDAVKAANQALCVAARYGDETMVKSLLESQADEVNTIHTVALQHTYVYEDLPGGGQGCWRASRLPRLWRLLQVVIYKLYSCHAPEPMMIPKE